MLRHALLALTLSLFVALPLRADTIVVGSNYSPYGPLYSPSSRPFEAFEWTPLDFAAFAAYGGDFSNVRRPVAPVTFFDDPMTPPDVQGPEDEQAVLRLLSSPFFEELPAGLPREFPETMPADVSEAAPSSIPEPGALLLVGIGLLGLSRRVRAYYAR
jgi:hypothetical protein